MTTQLQDLLDQVHKEGREVMPLEQFRSEVNSPQVQAYYDALVEMSKPENIIIHRHPTTPNLVGFSIAMDKEDVLKVRK